MMKLAVSLNLKLRIKGSCPAHPRYNPEQGQGAIRGNCQHCLALYAVTQARDQLHNAAARLEEVAQPYIVVRPRKQSTGIEDANA